jgi:hypothetical protein
MQCIAYPSTVYQALLFGRNIRLEAKAPSNPYHAISCAVNASRSHKAKELGSCLPRKMNIHYSLDKTNAP